MIDWATPTLLEFGPTQDCGCPMERWQYFGIDLHMHFEPEGVDVYLDGGEWDRNLTFASREAAIAWVAALPMEGAA